eukprot:s2771_g2.t1
MGVLGVWQIHGAAISHAGAWCKAEEEPAVRVLIAGISMHTLHNNLVVRSVSPTSGDSGIFLVVGYPDRKHLVHVLPWVDLVRALWLGFEVDERNWPGCRATILRFEVYDGFRFSQLPVGALLRHGVLDWR